jgi:hypothetical protein
VLIIARRASLSDILRKLDRVVAPWEELFFLSVYCLDDIRGLPEQMLA